MNAARLLLLSSGWHPRNLFRSGELGTVLNPSNLSAVFQDSTGQTAGAVGSAVGLLLDEQYRLGTGAELAANGGPFSATTGWSAFNSALSVASSELVVTSAAAGTAQGYFSVSTVAGKRYQVTATARKGTNPGSLTIDVWNGAAQTNHGTITSTSSTTTSGSFLAAGASADIKLNADATGAGQTFIVSSVSVKLLDGAHAAQSTAGSRPSLVAGGKVDYDGVDDALVITFPSDMGSACTVARSVPNGEATILTAQTITTTYTDSTDHCGLVIINRALTATETNLLRRWLNRRAG